MEGNFVSHGSPLFNSYVNGVYYWWATGSSGDLILSFDMVSEKFSTLPLPQTLVGFYSHLLDFNALLGAIFYLGKVTETSFDLWVMNESWTKQFSIKSVPGVEKLLGFWKNGELFIESSDHELVLFDPSTRELKNLETHQIDIEHKDGWGTTTKEVHMYARQGVVFLLELWFRELDVSNSLM
ncbi:hypothetical protein V6N12_002863 [Hibiscus sabdariffa]|uniref:F-box associated beta-propeller type 3 domain-containing protein n=1 Tax=Hibiscus sabdariffa TaxID=183260 RepID=A0ABR2EA77_9ROSI